MFLSYKREKRSKGAMAETEPVSKEKPETHEEIQNFVKLRRSGF